MNLLPAPPVNADNRPCRDGASAGRLMLPHCGACGHRFFMPRYQCPKCWSNDLHWTPASGRATIHSYCIVRRAALPAFADRVPYVLALIDLAEGPRMMSQILGEDALQAQIGAAVELCFQACADGAQLPQFRLVHHG
ncbi:Zn-ribbon domain-containing OB-fold protein [Verminephrobacter eiseniae]|uniref:Zn-ribbon domain-containing OB-fold protein n=1 Tax=Verminephrobacter eiseniae TaxID=364317 RepID=UPI002238C5D3|nr:Zn-ribbon domain-containing OB-fold protein [Verminephrobacter eiseniae]MCW5235035.1 Zn-ribbon domain-containing OB-fold protein [Verminephrobacter eiseniae]